MTHNTYTGTKNPRRRWQLAEVVRVSIDEYDYEFECRFVDPNGPSLLSGVPIIFRQRAASAIGYPRLNDAIEIETTTMTDWRRPRTSKAAS